VLQFVVKRIPAQHCSPQHKDMLKHQEKKKRERERKKNASESQATWREMEAWTRLFSPKVQTC
jgi:hypothetical protein